MRCCGSKFGSSGLSTVNGSVPIAKVDAAEIRRRALEARLSLFSLCRSAREIPSIRSGITDRDGVSETDDVENDATDIDVSGRDSEAEVAAVAMILSPFCPGVD